MSATSDEIEEWLDKFSKRNAIYSVVKHSETFSSDKDAAEACKNENYYNSDMLCQRDTY